MISFIIRLTSAWNVNFSACSFNSRNWAAFNPSNFIFSSSFIITSSSKKIFYNSTLSKLSLNYLNHIMDKLKLEI